MSKSCRVLLTVLLFGMLFIPPVNGHDASTYTINVRATEVQPSMADSLKVGDAAMWINFDSSNNTTHRIVYDADSDGLFNGSGEWDSGELLAWSADGTCSDENGNITEGCAVSFIFNFTSDSHAGTYQYQDLTYVDGVLTNTTNATLIVSLDVHVVDDTYCFGDDCEDEEQMDNEISAEADAPEWLLILAMISGGAAVLLGLKMVFITGDSKPEKFGEE